MKRVTLLCGLLLALTANLASAAGGLNLRWNACIGDGGIINRTFACNVNTGSNLLVAGFQLGADLPASSGQELVLDVATAGASLPAWWQFTGANCRAASLTMNTVISGSAINCADWGNGLAVGGIGAYQIGTRGPNTARIKIAIAVPGNQLQDLFGGQEYFSCNLNVNNQKTVGTGACAGCLTNVCIVFNSIKNTTQVPANDRITTGPANGFDSDFSTFQGGAGIVVPPTPGNPGGSGCGGATPTKSTTWGAVKALYHN